MPTLNPQPTALRSPNGGGSTLNPAAAAAPSPTRLPALDWVKGALVLFMVVYHGINYSVFRTMAFQYLAFLPPSFILIAGFIVGQVYAAKYDLTSFRPYFRLAIRGLKILALFTLLNLGYVVAQEKSLSEGFWEFGTRAGEIFLSGDGRVGIFEVLLPIGYFLLLAPMLLWTRSRSRFFVPCVATALCASCFLINSDNLEFLSVGVLGMTIGLVPMPTIDWLARKWPMVVLLYVGYRLLSFHFGETYPIQTTAAIVSVLILYSVGLHLDCASWLARQVILLGNYSLFAYLAQIPLLRLLVKAGGRPESVAKTAALIVIASVLLWATVRSFEFLRRNRHANEGYKLIFA